MYFVKFLQLGVNDPMNVLLCLHFKMIKLARLFLHFIESIYAQQISAQSSYLKSIPVDFFYLKWLIKSCILLIFVKLHLTFSTKGQFKQPLC